VDQPAPIADERASARAELGSFLARCRKALPQPAGGRRRTPGWRREEIAAAAGISVTWYSWAEQGRDVNLSAAALARLARALRLDAAQTAYVFRLARPASGAAESVAVDPALGRFVDGLEPHPAYLLDRGWSIVAANEAARRVFGFAGKGEHLIERLFIDPKRGGPISRGRSGTARVSRGYRAIRGDKS
jgi:transcriptional regulator with XRE-family HTH domain